MDQKDIIQAMQTVLRQNYKYLYVNSKLYMCDAVEGGVYSELQDHELEHQMEISVFSAGIEPEDLSSHVRHEVAEHIKSLSFMSIEDFWKHICKDYIPFENGYVSLSECLKSEYKVHPYTHTDSIFIQQIPHRVIFTDTTDPLEFLRSHAPDVFKFLYDVVGEENILLQLHKVGYSFIRDNPFKKFFIEYGTSDTGKTTFATLLELCVGKRNTSRVSLQDLSNNPFAGSELFNKLLNIWDDLPDIAINNTGMIKMLTGESPYSAHRKHMTDLSFEITASLLFTTNYLPSVKKKDDTVFFERVVLTNYQNTFPKNAGFKEKLYTEPNISALCTAAILSLKSLYEAGGFKEQEGIRLLWLRKNDSVCDYINTQIEANELELLQNEYIERDTLYNMYSMWAADNDRTAVSKNTFTRSLESLFAISVAQRREGTRRFYAYVGIRIPPEPTPLPNIPSTTQTSLKTPLERTESNLREQAPAPQPKLCRVCHTSTSTLVHDPRGEGGFICIDCLNEYQRKNEDE